MTKNEIRRLGERYMVRGLLQHMETEGWVAYWTNDGETLFYPANEDAVMAIAFNLDEVSIRFAPAALVKAYRETDASVKDARRKARDKCDDAAHGVLLVFGNSADEVISDWNYNDGDADGFNAVMCAYTDYTNDGGPLAQRWLAFSPAKADAKDQIAVLAYPCEDRTKQPVLFGGTGAFYKVGEARSMEGARAVLDGLGLTYQLEERIADNHSLGWKRPVFVATASK